jgi:hypothetical protein
LSLFLLVGDTFTFSNRLGTHAGIGMLGYQSNGYDDAYEWGISHLPICPFDYSVCSEA